MGSVRWLILYDICISIIITIIIKEIYELGSELEYIGGIEGGDRGKDINIVLIYEILKNFRLHRT